VWAWRGPAQAGPSGWAGLKMLRYNFILPLVMQKSWFYIFYLEWRKEIMCTRTKKLDLILKEIGFNFFLRISGSIFTKGQESYLPSKFVRRKKHGNKMQMVKNDPNLLIMPDSWPSKSKRKFINLKMPK
jgi:hypothetical protein